MSLSIPPHKVQSKLPEIFTEKELESLFRHDDTLRNRILLMTTYSGGLRVSSDACPIEVCRTSELGGHIEQCDRCGFEHHAYNSCRNRHCLKCQALTTFTFIV